MIHKKNFYIAFLFSVCLHNAKSKVPDHDNSAGTFRSTNMIMVEGGTIPKWSASNFEKQLAELKEDPICGWRYKRPSEITRDLRNEYSKSILQGEKVKTFLIADVETTLGEWKRVLEWAKGHGYENLDDTGFGASDDHPVRATDINTMIWCNAKSEMEGFKPVYKIRNQVYKIGPETKNSTYPKTVYFPDIDLKANGYRLPTEIEWEWAAIGGVNSKGYLFSGSNKPSEVAWHEWNTENTIDPLKYSYCPVHTAIKYENVFKKHPVVYCAQGPMPVALKKPNELGLYDMSGNVAELCGEGVPRGGSFNNMVLYPYPCQNTPWKGPYKHNYKNIPYTTLKKSTPHGFRLARNYESKM